LWKCLFTKGASCIYKYHEKNYVWLAAGIGYYRAACNRKMIIPLTAEAGEQYSGGTATVENTTEKRLVLRFPAYHQMTEAFGVGNSFFRKAGFQHHPAPRRAMGLGRFLTRFHVVPVTLKTAVVVRLPTMANWAPGCLCA
jgi:hypothetical protein